MAGRRSSRRCSGRDVLPSEHSFAARVARTTRTCGPVVCVPAQQASQLTPLSHGETMPERSPEINGMSIVLIGNFNPAIFHSAWFAKFGLLPEEESSDIENQVILP